MNHIIAKKLRKPLAVIGIALLYSGQAQATCNILGVFDHPINFTNDIPVKQSTPPGEVVAARSTSSNAPMLRCNADPNPILFRGRYNNPSESEIPGVYRTAVPGIGVRIRYQGEEVGTEQLLPFNVNRVFTANTELRARAGDLTVELVRIAGDIEAGNLPVGPVAQVNTTVATGTTPYRAIRVQNIVIRVPTCAITTGSLNQTVDLGSWRASDFGAPGTGSEWREFALVSEECELAEFSRVDMEFNGTADASNADLFRVTGGAAGVGIELRTDGDMLVSPGTTASMPPVAAGGQYRFRARYTRTAAALSSGRANAAVTITVSYH